MAPMSVSPVVRVTVVGSNPILCAGLASLLDGYEDIQVVAVGAAAAQCRDVEPDVAVVGLAGFGLDAATRTIGHLRARSETKLVAVVDAVDEVLGWVVAAQVDACLDVGTVDSYALVDTVRAVMGGQVIVPTELLPELRKRERAMAPGRTLTARERDVLALLAKGQSNKSIADQLELRVGTVRVYVSLILAKLGVTNRTEATVVTLRDGLLNWGTLPAAANNEIASATHRRVGVQAS
jgi:two-component system, NarL family, response regulator LiaR